MLNRIKLTNFQRHRALEVTLSGGFTALRGGNEQGKSTLLRAIAYALSGVKTLKDPLEELVTWGEDVKTLKVELDLVVDHVVYTVTRSPRGAEVNYDGGKVTGQNEVTNFLSRLLGMDAAMVSRLPIANQGEIRGALEEGTKATTALIERLAEFEVLDQLLERMSEELTLGSTASAEMAIKAAEATVESLEGIEKPDTAEILQQLSGARLDVDARLRAVGELQTTLEAAQVSLSSAKVAQAEWRAANDAQAAAERRYDAAKAKLDGLPVLADPGNVEEQCDGLRQRIEAAKGVEAVRAVYAKVGWLLTPTIAMSPLTTLQEAETRVKELKQSIQVLTVKLATDRGTVKLHEQALHHGSCTFCGKDFSDVPEVATRNAETLAKIDALNASIAEDMETISSERALLGSLEKSIADSQPAIKMVAAHPDLVQIAKDEVPLYLKWVGPNPEAEAENVAGLQDQIRALQQARRDYDANQAARAAALAALSSAQHDLQQAELHLEEVGDPGDLTIQQERVSVEKERLGLARGALDTARDTVHQLTRQIDKVEGDYAAAAAQLESARKVLDQRREELKTLTFNNALLRKVRAARPLIADRLWNLVLSTVSSYLTELRGEESEVTKDTDGFKVNGHSATTLSGSALDLLGLAIRVALVKTFLPQANFLLLDEPAAACSDSRTSDMLGFLSSCGFQQLVLITHEDLSETVADNLVTIGG